MKDIRRTISQGYSDRLVASLIGTPYETLDCWGICKEFYKLHGIKLKDYYDVAPNDQSLSADIADTIAKDLVRVDLPEYGDFILIDVLGFPSHCGIYLGGGKMLHTNKNSNCIVDKVYRWRKKIIAYYKVAE